MEKNEFNSSIVIDVEKYKKFRRDLHQIPELKYQEHLTKKFIYDYISNFKNFQKFKIVEIGETGFFIDVIGEADEVTIVNPFLKKMDGSDNINKYYGIAFRCDLDGLPLIEETGVDYKSKFEGKAHSCGHDGHMTILTCFLEYITDKISIIPKNVLLRFIYQPAEETGNGSIVMINGGCLEGINEIHGIHNFTNFQLGEVGLVEGPIMASIDVFEIEITGVGGHGSVPHLSKSPITTGSEVVQKVNQLLSQRVDSLYRCALSFGYFKSGEASNIIPEKAILKGTLRTLDNKNRENVVNIFKKTVEGVVALNESTVDIKIENVGVVTDNHPELTKLVSIPAAEKVGLKRVTEGCPVMGSEDFSYYQQIIPGVFILLGTKDENHTSVIHSPFFDYNDLGTPSGVEYYCRILELKTNKIFVS